MSDQLNPLWNTISDKLKDLETRLNPLERARQPYQGDWFDANPSDPVFVDHFSTTPNQFRLSLPLGLMDIVQIGDRIRITQAGVTYYFYLINKDTVNNYITILGLDSIVIDGSAFTLFSWSRVPAPTGFTQAILTKSTFGNYNTGTFAFSNTTFSSFVNMTGKLVRMYGNQTVSFTAYTSGNSNVVGLRLPTLDVPVTSQPTIAIRPTINSVTQDGLLYVSVDPVDSHNKLVFQAPYLTVGFPYSVTLYWDYTYLLT